MFMALASLLIMLYPGPGWEIVFVLCSASYLVPCMPLLLACWRKNQKVLE